MDLAKMLAILRLINPLAGSNFRIWTQTRTGLLSYPVDLTAARAHIAASVYVQMALKPQIVHVVGYTEAHHAATADEVIESCWLARRAIENALGGAPDMLADPRVLERAGELVEEAKITLKAIGSLAVREGIDPLTDPAALARTVTSGILDAPHLANNPYARGQIVTRIRDGACVATGEDGTPLSEAKRLAQLI